MGEGSLTLHTLGNVGNAKRCKKKLLVLQVKERETNDLGSGHSGLPNLPHFALLIDQSYIKARTGWVASMANGSSA